MQKRNVIQLFVSILMTLFLFVFIGCTKQEQDKDKDKEKDIIKPTATMNKEVEQTSQPETKRTLVWSDEFDYEGLPDPDRWGYDVGGTGWGNDELQYYTENRLDNASVAEGELKITAIKEDYEGRGYTSARLVSRDKGDWLYGRFEIKAKLPKGVGTWPAIWMLPTDWAYGGWPNSGEIDIMEHVGFDHGNVHGSTHSLKYYWKDNTQKSAAISVDRVDMDFHVYAMEWTPGKIEVFVDDKSYFIATYDPAIDQEDGWEAWPFDKRFHLLLNIAVGGAWGGQQGVDESIWPQTMTVDYVRVYDIGIGEADKEPPTAPSLLKGEPIAVAVPLTWASATDNVAVAKYEIYQGDTLIGETATNAFVASGLEANTKYTFKIRAVDYKDNRSNFVIGDFQTGELNPVLLPAQIKAEDFIQMQGVQTELSSDEDGGNNVGWIEANDWMEYTVKVAKEQAYNLDVRIASESSGGMIELYDESGKIIVTLPIPVTGGWQTWRTISSDSFKLPEGTYNIRLVAAEGGFNLNWFAIK